MLVVDDAGFPNVARYLAGLPNGIDSYPGCLAKASLFRSMVDRSPLVGIGPDELPPVIVALLDDPPPVTAWIPEAHSHALLLAVYDRNFRSERAFATWCYQAQRELFEGPLYRFMFLVVSPMLLLRGAERRWRTFHRGSQLRVERTGSKSAHLTLTYPGALWDDVSLVGLCEGLRAAIEAAGARRAKVAVARSDEGRALLEGTWS